MGRLPAAIRKLNFVPDRESFIMSRLAVLVAAWTADLCCTVEDLGPRLRPNPIFAFKRRARF
jgi:hypothetical protein